jgi:hypothetical protein
MCAVLCGHSEGVASAAPSAIPVLRQSNAQPGAFLSGTGNAVPFALLRSHWSADLRDNCPRDDRARPKFCAVHATAPCRLFDADFLSN